MGAYLGQSVYNDSQVTEEWVEEQIEENGKGVFWVTYGTTTKDEITAAVNNGKICVLKDTNPAGAVDYAVLTFKGVGNSFNFITPLDVYGDYTIYSVALDGTWSKTSKNSMPSVTSADNEKVLTVVDGEVKFDYLQTRKLGVESPLTFKKDTDKELVAGFNTTQNDYLKVLKVNSNGEAVFEKPEYKLFGVESPLQLVETENTIVIKAGGQISQYFEYDNDTPRTWTYGDLMLALNNGVNPIIRHARAVNDWLYYRLTRLWDDGNNFNMEFVTIDVKTLNSSQTVFGAIYIRDDDVLTHDSTHFT